MKDWISISHKAHNKNHKYDVDEKHQGWRYKHIDFKTSKLVY